MDPGKLDRRITLQQRVVSRHPTLKSEQVEWVDVATVWAQVLPSSTAAAAAALVDAAMYARPTKVRIRWRAGVDASTYRISYEGGRLLRITGTAELGRREYVEMACEEWAHE